MRAHFAKNFKALAIDKYDGMGDPEEHLTMLHTQMLLTTSTDSKCCRAFATTLSEAALVWFSRLASNSIYSFNDLANYFCAQFATSQAHHKTSASLVNFRQGASETLREFMSRFRKETLQIRDLSPTVALHAVLTRLRGGLFADSLARKPSVELTNLDGVQPNTLIWRK